MSIKYSSLSQLLKEFSDEKKCVEYLEKMRWPKGVICPFCGKSRKFYRITRGYLNKCGDCNKSFSVRKNTIFEESRLPLRTWFSALWLCTTKPSGINSYQLARELNITQRTASFMLTRLNEIASLIESEKQSEVINLSKPEKQIRARKKKVNRQNSKIKLQCLSPTEYN